LSRSDGINDSRGEVYSVGYVAHGQNDT